MTHIQLDIVKDLLAITHNGTILYISKAQLILMLDALRGQEYGTNDPDVQEKTKGLADYLEQFRSVDAK